MKKWKLIPKVTFTNYRKSYPNMPATTFSQWLWIYRGWSGRIITINVKHYAVSFDFRRDWVADMMNK